MAFGPEFEFFGAFSSGAKVLPKASVWTMKAFDRGWEIEKLLGGMGNNFPTIDKFVNGAKGFAKSITSIKSMDLGAKTYQKGNAVYNTIIKYANDLSGFKSTTWSKITVNVNSSTQRILELALPTNVSAAQLEQINKAIIEAGKKGIDVVIKYIK